MPAYSFKERFVQFVLDGSKSNTIRSRRKHPAKPGDILYLYTGLRTKHCRKLREEECLFVQTILINHRGNVFLHHSRIDDKEAADLLTRPENYPCPMFKDSSWKELSIPEKNRLAWLDGFRPIGSTLDHPFGAFSMMLRFWEDTHALPFIGDLIHWTPSEDPGDGAYCD